MTSKCEKCKFTLVDNKDALETLKMLRSHKIKGIHLKYPFLIADFYCENVKNKKCDYTEHVKWVDLEKDINVMQCPKCNGKILSSVFLGIMSGFHLESYCFNCFAKKSSGTIGFQK